MSEIGQSIRSKFTCGLKETSLLRRCWQDMNPVQTYCEKAAQARRLAKSVMDPATREQLEIAARDYDQMADQTADQTEGRSARGR
jgi:hypothetical protein